MSDPVRLPAWAREDAFPLKPAELDYGVVDSKGVETAFGSLEELNEFLGKGKGRLAWVWTPESDRLVAPEECGELLGCLKKRRMIFVKDDESDARRFGVLFGLVLLWTIWSGWSGGGWQGLWSSQNLGMAVLMFVLFAVRPWWEAWKGRREVAEMTKESLESEVPEARFDLWMDLQRVFLAWGLVVVLGLVGLGQILGGENSIELAGLVKERYLAGEWWRIYTAGFLHGNVVHFAMNVGGLWYLSRRIEILARWPHLAAVFLLSLVGAGWATVAWMPQTSVGVSGAVCGMLGFLLVFETLHDRLVPRKTRRRLLGGLMMLVVIGALGFRLIDNAAHFGGLVTGAVYAVVVFPKSSSVERPVVLGRDLVMGGGCLLVIGLIAMFTLFRIV